MPFKGQVPAVFFLDKRMAVVSMGHGENFLTSESGVSSSGSL
jgi:hypothetical protein